MLVADNTHLVVAEKIAKWRQQQEELENPNKRKENEDCDEEVEEVRKKGNKKLLLCTAQTKYRVIKKACRRQDFRLDSDEGLDWDLYWADTGVQMPRIHKLQPYQRINHYPGMHCLSHKNNLSRNLKRM